MERKSERDGAGRNREGSVDAGKRDEEKGRHCRRETWGQGVGTEVVRQDKRWRVTCRASGEIRDLGEQSRLDRWSRESGELFCWNSE